MSLQTLRVELSEPLPGKFLANCTICSWELWSRGELAVETLTESWEKHARIKHGIASKQGRLTEEKP